MERVSASSLGGCTSRAGAELGRKAPQSGEGSVPGSDRGLLVSCGHFRVGETEVQDVETYRRPFCEFREARAPYRDEATLAPPSLPPSSLPHSSSGHGVEVGGGGTTFRRWGSNGGQQAITHFTHKNLTPGTQFGT